MTCLVTGILRDLSGDVLPNTDVYFSQTSVFGQADGVSLPSPVMATSDVTGLISIDLYPGNYQAVARAANGTIEFTVAVPDEVTADLSDLVNTPDVSVAAGLVQQARAEADRAEDEADRAEDAANAVDTTGFWVEDAASFFTDTIFGYTTGIIVVADQYIRSRKEGFAWQVADAGTPIVNGYPMTIPGGVKVYVEVGPDGFSTFRQLGAAGNGTTDDGDVFRLASGRRVKGTAGDIYYTAVPDFTDAIRYDSNTAWHFPVGCYWKYDNFGCPLSYANLNASNIEIVRPQFLYDGTAVSPLPYTNGEMRDEYLIPASGAIGFACTMYFAGAENVRVVSPSHKAVTPGSHKSQYAFIRLNNKYDALLDNDNYTNADRATNIEISDIYCDDCNFGVLGGGYSNIDLPGYHYTGRYESFHNDTSFSPAMGAPEHFLYISGYLDVERLTVGSIYDAGNDQTENSAGPRSAETLKFRKVRRAQIGPVTSFRAHGVIDGEGYENITFGPIHYVCKDPSDLLSAPMRISAEEDSANIIFTNTLLDIGATDVGAFNFLGETTFFISNLDLGDMTIKQEMSGAYAEQMLSFENIIGLKGNLSLDITGSPPANATLVRLEDCSDVDLNITFLSLSTVKRVVQADVNTNVRVTMDSLSGPIYYDQKELEDANYLGSSVRSSSGDMTRALATTSGTWTYQLPHQGSFHIGFKVWRGGSHGRQNLYAVLWGTSPALMVAEELLAADINVGTDFTGLSAAVDAAGLVTFTATSGSAIDMDAEISVLAFGIGKANA